MAEDGGVRKMVPAGEVAAMAPERLQRSTVIEDRAAHVEEDRPHRHTVESTTAWADIYSGGASPVPRAFRQMTR